MVGFQIPIVYSLFPVYESNITLKSNSGDLNCRNIWIANFYLLIIQMVVWILVQQYDFANLALRIWPSQYFGAMVYYKFTYKSVEGSE